jgi:hypothetical protein
MKAAIQFCETISVHDEQFNVIAYRRNYYRCRSGCGRSGTVLLSATAIPHTFRTFPDRHKTEKVRILAVCEVCGRRWMPSTGPALRAMGR